MDALDRLEAEMLVLARRIETAARQSTTYDRMERAAYLIARTLDRDGPSTVNDLARMLALDGSTLTRQVAAMESRRQATRRVHPDDARAWIISLTPVGHDEMAAIDELRRRRFAGWTAGWDAEDIDRLGSLLGRLNTAIADDPQGRASAAEAPSVGSPGAAPGQRGR